LIKYLTHNNIDKKKWDDAISSSQNKFVYACSWYLDVVSPNWDALVLNDYEAIMPITHRKKYGFQYLFQPYFTQQLGTFSKQKITEKICCDFINAIPNQFRLIEININNHVKQLLNGFVIKENKNHELDLNSNYEKLYAAFSDSTKRNIKKAEKNGIAIDKAGKIETVIQLFKKGKGQEIKSMKDAHYKTLNQLTNILSEKNAINIWIAKNASGKIIAGALFVQYFGRIIFLFSGNSEEGKEKGAMHYLINEIIKQYSGTPSLLDFEGSNDINLARFYKSFGSKESVYLQVRKNNLPKYIKWLKK
jgi:hypothetical protein